MVDYSTPPEICGYTTPSGPGVLIQQNTIGHTYASAFPEQPLDAYVDPIIPSLNSLSLRPPVGFDSDAKDDDNDPEGIRLILCVVPHVDKNVTDNALPFVLHCYSQWAIVRVFEPQSIAHAMRDQVIAQFAFDKSRTRTILVANVMNIFARNLVLDDTAKSILTYLAADVQESGSQFMLTPPSFVPALDRQNAMRTLDSMFEIFSLQAVSQSIFECVQTLDCAAPVFRRACSEPPGQPLNLLTILLGPNLNLRHFATLDVIKAVTTGLPTYFQYEVPFSLEMCERINQAQDQVGLRWLHGFPDQFILMLAWMNSLYGTPGASNPELVDWIERTLSQIKITINESGDPSLRLGRVVVQECWRFTVLIYLYMALCGANACDPRVIKAQKGYMRIMRGVKPARNPDAYLYIPMSIVGAATLEERDRNTLRQRVLGVRECAEEGSTGHNALLTMEDIWARTRDEGRPAVWSDLRIASFRVVGR